MQSATVSMWQLYYLLHIHWRTPAAQANQIYLAKLLHKASSHQYFHPVSSIMLHGQFAVVLHFLHSIVARINLISVLVFHCQNQPNTSDVS